MLRKGANLQGIRKPYVKSAILWDGSDKYYVIQCADNYGQC